MERIKIIFILGGLCLYGAFAFAQDKNRYVVYFKDKADSKYAIHRPEAFLSQAALRRRQKGNIRITTQDLPVNQSYVDALAKAGATPYFRSKWLNATLVEATAQVIHTLQSLPYVLKVDYAAPGQRLNGKKAPPNMPHQNAALTPPSNPFRLNTQRQLDMLSAQMMHQEGFTGAGVWIAVFDGGFIGANRSSAFAQIFQGQRLKDVFDYTTGGQDVFQYADHGTKVWSGMAANYHQTLLGTGYGATFSLYVTEEVSTEYRIEEYNWLFAAERADSLGVDIISSSLGYYHFDDASMNYQYKDLDGKTSIVSQAAALTTAKGILVVCSTGNVDGNYPYLLPPSDVQGVLSVGAVDARNRPWEASATGPTADGRTKPDIVAPGAAVTVLAGNNQILNVSGTSYSAALMAGWAAGIWQKFPMRTNSEIRDVIVASADHYYNPNQKVGYGLPDYRVAAGHLVSIPSDWAQGVIAYPNPVSGNEVKVVFKKGFVDVPVSLKLLTVTGQLVDEKNITSIKEGVPIPLTFRTTLRGVFILNIQAKNYRQSLKLMR